MDLATVIGMTLAVALILGSILMGGAPFSTFIDIPSILVVLGGSLGAVLICFPLRTVLLVPGVTKKVFLNRAVDYRAIIAQLVSLAETARRDGLLALESRLEKIDNPFIKLGIQLAVDGTRPEVIESILRSEMESLATRHKDGKSLYDQLGKYAPAYGMIGTLLGLIMMLSNMSDPSGIGKGMAVALITTLYGSVVANVVCLPFAEKLAFLNKQELYGLEIIIRGIMDIQSGENPRVIQQKLNTFLPPKQRVQPEDR
ncbi:MAG: flagellar motor protein MotP [Pirellulaceae bacterium]|nr:MAG: flagellar motor protein MotP [Pirellulaceae bacterium]